MSLEKILLLEPGLLDQGKTFSADVRQLVAFLSERGESILNFKYSEPARPVGSLKFEEAIHLSKEADLVIAILQEDSTLLGFLISLFLQRSKRSLIFSRNRTLVDNLRKITIKQFYAYHYQRVSEIINTLKLFRI